MSISGKMSVGVFLIDATPSNKMSSAITTNVYGRRSANFTIHIKPEKADGFRFGRSRAELTRRRVWGPRIRVQAPRCALPPDQAETNAGKVTNPTPSLLLCRGQFG